MKQMTVNARQFTNFCVTAMVCNRNFVRDIAEQRAELTENLPAMLAVLKQRGEMQSFMSDMLNCIIPDCAPDPAETLPDRYTWVIEDSTYNKLVQLVKGTSATDTAPANFVLALGRMTDELELILETAKTIK